MPKTGRDKLQRKTLIPARLLAFYFGEKLHKHIESKGAEVPPLKWCCMAALFAGQGQYENTHRLYPNWLEQSFIKRKDLTIYSMDWCYRKYLQFISKAENEVVVTALYCAFNNNQKMVEGGRIDSQDLLETAQKYEWSRDHTDDILTKAANKVQNLHENYIEFTSTQDGQYWHHV